MPFPIKFIGVYVRIHLRREYGASSESLIMPSVQGQRRTSDSRGIERTVEGRTQGNVDRKYSGRKS